MEFSTENSFSPSASKVLGRCQYFWRARAWLSLILQSARRPVSREKVLYACKASVRRACGSSAVVLCWNCSSLHVKIGTCDVSRCGHRPAWSHAQTQLWKAGAPTSQSQFFRSCSLGQTTYTTRKHQLFYISTSVWSLTAGKDKVHG